MFAKFLLIALAVSSFICCTSMAPVDVMREDNDKEGLIAQKIVRTEQRPATRKKYES